MGLTFSTTAKLSVFYVGDNGVLHRVDQGEGDNFQRAEQQGPDTWPVADTKSSTFGITSDFNTNQIWIYYMSGGRMNQVYQSKSNVWERAVALRQEESLSPASGQDSGDGSGQGNTGDSENSGLSKAAKIGIGVGVSLGVITLGVLVGAWSWFYRRRKAREGVAELPGSIRGPDKSPVPPNPQSPDHLDPSPSELSPPNQQTYPVEKQGTELFELPIQGQRHEMDDTQLNELPHHEVYEMPDNSSQRPETKQSTT